MIWYDYRWFDMIHYDFLLLWMYNFKTIFCRSIGKVKEAEAIEAQLRAKMGGAAAPGFAAAAPQGQYQAASAYYAGYWNTKHHGSDAQVVVG